MVQLSARMQAVADLVPAGSVVADVGCDHGHVSIYLVQQRICEHVIAMDVNPGPLAHARENIESAGLSDYIETRLGDGLEALRSKRDKPEADTVILAGMGGPLMIRILTEAAEKVSGMKRLILQPQSEIAKARRFLAHKAGYAIIKENMVLEDGKFYSIMCAVNASDGNLCREAESLTALCGGSQEAESLAALCGGIREAERLAEQYGGCLLAQKHPVLQQYLEKEKRVYCSILEHIRDQESLRYQEIKEKLYWNEKAMACMG